MKLQWKHSIKTKIINLLNQIMEVELAGVVRYTHSSFLRAQSDPDCFLASRTGRRINAQKVGELITLLPGENASLAIGPLLDTHRHNVGAIMREALETEAKALALYRALLK
jgi:bacterioferritin